MVKALAGVAVLAGFCYVVANRKTTRAPQSVAPSPRATRVPEPAVAAAWDEDAATLPTNDALDLALGFDDLADREPGSGVELTARANDHLPLPRTGDDDDAPSPDDLASAWLAHATESERSLTAEDLLLDVDSLERASEELTETYSLEGDCENDDETTREYVRRHRISLLG